MARSSEFANARARRPLRLRGALLSTPIAEEQERSGRTNEATWQGLLEGSAILASARRFEVLLRYLARTTARACGVDRCSIFLWRDHRLIPTMSQFASGAHRRDLWRAFNALDPIRVDDIPMLARAFSNRAPFVVAEPLEIGLPRHRPEVFKARSVLVLPLLVGDRVIGVITLDNGPGSAPIASDQIGRFRPLMTQLARAIDAGRWFADLRRRLQATETLLNVGRTVGSTLDLREVTRRIAREAARALGADSGGIYVVSESGRLLQPLAAHHVPKRFLDAIQSEPIALEGFPRLDIGPRWSDDVPNDPDFQHACFKQFPTQSILLTPLLVRDKRVGLLVCAWWTKRRRFVPEELRWMEGIAVQAAMAIVNARLYARVEEQAVTGERARMDHVLHDTLSQTLFSMALRLERCRREGRLSTELRSMLEALREDTQRLMTEMRQLISPRHRTSQGDGQDSNRPR